MQAIFGLFTRVDLYAGKGWRGPDQLVRHLRSRYHEVDAIGAILRGLASLAGKFDSTTLA